MLASAVTQSGELDTWYLRADHFLIIRNHVFGCQMFPMAFALASCMPCNILGAANGRGTLCTMLVLTG